MRRHRQKFYSLRSLNTFYYILGLGSRSNSNWPPLVYDFYMFISTHVCLYITRRVTGNGSECFIRPIVSILVSFFVSNYVSLFVLNFVSLLVSLLVSLVSLIPRPIACLDPRLAARCSLESALPRSWMKNEHCFPNIIIFINRWFMCCSRQWPRRARLVPPGFSWFLLVFL